MSLDPLTKSYPWYTPYQFAGNKPVRYIDLDGLEEYDPMQDEFFVARLVLTTIFDIKHSLYNVAFASQGNDSRARYKRDENGNEIFETEFYQRSPPASLSDFGQNTLHDGLDVLNVAVGGKIDASDFFSIRTGGKNQFIQSAKNAIEAKGLGNASRHYQKHVLNINPKSGKPFENPKNSYSAEQFPTEKSFEDYSKDFFQRTGDDILTFTSKEGYTHRFDKSTGEYGLIDGEGNVNTVFKPKQSEEYFNAQVETYGN